MRGLDDALDRLARRDQLRRRANGESTGAPAAVTELVEAIAAVVGRHPELAVTVGVEGVGDPTLLHFAVEDGIVQVSADNSVGQRVPDPGPGDYIDADADEPYTPPHGYAFEQPTNGHGYPVHQQPAEPQPHPFAAAPPPEVPTQAPPAAFPADPHVQPFPAAHPAPPSSQDDLLPPLPEPIPLRVDEQETEQAARRLAALLREDPSLLHSQE